MTPVPHGVVCLRAARSSALTWAAAVSAAGSRISEGMGAWRWPGLIGVGERDRVQGKVWVRLAQTGPDVSLPLRLGSIECISDAAAIGYKAGSGFPSATGSGTLPGGKERVTVAPRVLAGFVLSLAFSLALA